MKNLYQFNFTPEEARRLADMCFHIAEEAHDDAECPEPWHSEDWWNSLAYHTRDQMKSHGITEEFIIGLGEGETYADF